MNKLQQLKSQIERLPEKRKLATLVSVLEKYNSQIEKAFEILSETRKIGSHMQGVSPEMDLKSVDEKILAASRTAQRLRKSLSENIENIKKADDKIIAIEITSKSSFSLLRDKWRSMLQSKIDTYAKIVKAASGANLAGSQAMTGTLERLRGRLEVPPDTEEKAAKTLADLNSVADSIQALGLVGKVGDFLTAAANNDANARLLLDEEIQDFLEKNQLWKNLTVRLG